MSYQYIAYRYDSDGDTEPVRDGVHYTEGMEETLVTWLESASKYKLPANIGILGPQYSYRLHRDGKAIYHVLSCIRSIKDQASNAKGYVAHHLVMTEGEVLMLKNTPMGHPTPAGVILALEKSGLWETGTTGQTINVNREPEVSITAFPDASRQETWKRVTGHKNLACAFFTPPYDTKCIMLLPTPMDVRNVLMLLHESDWLSVGKGWGHTFTTYGTEGENADETQRIALPIGSPLVISEAWSKIPALYVNERLTLEAPKELEPITYTAPPPEDTTPKRVAPTIPVPYRYVEVRDSQMFDIRRRLTRAQMRTMIIALLVILSAGLYILMNSVGTNKERTKIHTEQDGRDMFRAKHVPKRPKQDGAAVQLVLRQGNDFPVKKFISLVRKGVHISTYPVPAPAERRGGRVQNAELTQKGIILYFTDRYQGPQTVELELRHGKLKGVETNGVPAMVHLSGSGGEVIVAPRLRIELPKPVPCRLPDIVFNVRPENLAQDKTGMKLVYFDYDHRMRNEVPWRDPFIIQLPLFSKNNLHVSCKTGGDVPYEVQLGQVQQRGHLQGVRVELFLFNPFRYWVDHTFQDLMEAPLSMRIHEYSLAWIYEFARRESLRTISPMEVKGYEAARNECRRYIHLPAYHPDNPALHHDILEAICDKVNADLQRVYEEFRQNVEGYTPTLMLELKDLYFEDDGTGLHWGFELRAPAKTSSPLPMP